MLMTLISSIYIRQVKKFFQHNFGGCFNTQNTPLRTGLSSICSHSLSHQSSLAFWVSFRSSLCSWLYICFPYSVLIPFHFLLSSIFCSTASVTHGFSLCSFCSYIQWYSSHLQ